MPAHAAVLRSPGTNCDVETVYAFEKAGGRAERVHVKRLLEEPERLHQSQVLIVAGGFSYGDDIAAGKVLANQLRCHLAEQLRRFYDDGKLILGICNGFQVLVKAGLLPEPASTNGEQRITLTDNDSGKFEDRWVQLQCEPGNCVFLQGIEQLYLPVAHGEGKFVLRDDAVLQTLEAHGQCVLRYAGGDGPTMDYPANPNGSIGAIAGICDPQGRVLGLMPHPERHTEPTHHPRWTREGLKSEGDGLALFRNVVEYFR